MMCKHCRWVSFQEKCLQGRLRVLETGVLLDRATVGSLEKLHRPADLWCSQAVCDIVIMWTPCLVQKNRSWMELVR